MSQINTNAKLDGHVAETGSTRALKVMTVNAHKGFTVFNRKFILPELRDAVRSVGADVVFLQEVLGTHAVHSLRHIDWPETPQYEFLADTIWPEFAYGKNAVYPAGHHGNALLSKFPIVHFENYDASAGDPEQRGMLHCVVKAPDWRNEVHAVCVHFGLLESYRQVQLRILCRLIAKKIPADAPVVVAGDFNDWRLRAHGPLRRCAGLREVFVERRGKAAKTFPARWPLLSLDRIYVRHGQIRSAITMSTKPWSHLSDHAPLAAEIHL